MAKKIIQSLAKSLGMTEKDFIGEMIKLDTSYPTAKRLWDGVYEDPKEDALLSSIRKAAKILRVETNELL